MAENTRSLAIKDIPTSRTPVFTAGTTWPGSRAQFYTLRIVNKLDPSCWVSLWAVLGGVEIMLLSQQPIDRVSPWIETFMLNMAAGDHLDMQAQSQASLDALLAGYDGVA